MLDYRIAVAPMMDCTDRHYRYFMRLISRYVLLFTEMISVDAIVHGDRNHLLKFNVAEHPVVIQIGGSDCEALSSSACIVEDYGYDGINLNMGCPSERVQSGSFGAALMKELTLAADCVSAVKSSVNIPVSVKLRIGVDDHDTYEHLSHFIHALSSAGCETFIIHARKAWLKGLSPKENRNIPPLQYDLVRKIKNDYPHLTIIINGGITDIKKAREEFQDLDGIMIGREAYHNPYKFASVDHDYFNDAHAIPSRHDIIHGFIPYATQELAVGAPLHLMIRPILNLFRRVPGAKKWRRYLTENINASHANITAVHEALQLMM